MSNALVGLIGFAIVALLVTVVILLKRTNVNEKVAEVKNSRVREETAPLVIQPVEEAEALPTEILFGTDPTRPIITVRPLKPSQFDAVANMQTITPSVGVATRLSGLMQAAPSLLVAEAHRGRQLMEVVIDGALVRAKDGDGFRAMTYGTKGIKEHARLYETKDLTNLVNAAAVWQLASVIVAQKHMADISQKLGEIKDGVNRLSQFLESERRAVIQGTYGYLQQAYDALAKGELPPSIRSELESCERQLLAIQSHLKDDLQRRARLEPRDDDSFGTESLYKNSVSKYHAMDVLVEDLNICLATRALAWYVLSLYPGEQELKSVRCESIKQGLQEFRELETLVGTESRVDTARFRSMWNSGNTLEERKNEVLQTASRAQGKLQSARTSTIAQLETSQTRLLECDSSTQLVVELFDGSVQKVRQRELLAA